MPNYFKIFTNNKHDDVIANISQQMEGIVEDLSNTRDAVIINMMEKYPFLSVKAHKSLSDNRWLNLLYGIILPIGIVAYLRIWRYRFRLEKDLKVIIETDNKIIQRIKDQQLDK